MFLFWKLASGPTGALQSLKPAKGDLEQENEDANGNDAEFIEDKGQHRSSNVSVLL